MLSDAETRRIRLTGCAYGGRATDEEAAFIPPIPLRT